MKRTLALSMATSSLTAALMTLVIATAVSPRAAEAQVPVPPVSLQYKSVAAEQFVLPQHQSDLLDLAVTRGEVAVPEESHLFPQRVGVIQHAV